MEEIKAPPIVNLRKLGNFMGKTDITSSPMTVIHLIPLIIGRSIRTGMTIHYPFIQQGIPILSYEVLFWKSH